MWLYSDANHSKRYANHINDANHMLTEIMLTCRLETGVISVGITTVSIKFNIQLGLMSLLLHVQVINHSIEHVERVNMNVWT